MTARARREVDTLRRIDEALPRLEAILRRTVSRGLTRAGEDTAVALESAANIAHTASLIHIERGLATFATQVRRYAERDPLFDPIQTMELVHSLWRDLHTVRRLRAADQGLQEMLPTLGQARRRYTVLARPLPTQVLGAVGWVSDSGFVGISIHLAELGTTRMLTASVVRPTFSFGEDPTRLARFPVHDDTAQTILDLAHGAWIFEQAKRSADGRLSLYSGLGIHPGPSVGLRAYQPWAATSWVDLVERLDPSSPALLTLSAVGPLQLDDKRGFARLPIYDANGAVLFAHIALASHHNLWIDNLEYMALDPDHLPEALFGRAWISDGEVRFEPWTAVYHQWRLLTVRGRPRRVHEVHLSVEALSSVERP